MGYDMTFVIVGTIIIAGIVCICTILYIILILHLVLPLYDMERVYPEPNGIDMIHHRNWSIESTSPHSLP